MKVIQPEGKKGIVIGAYQPPLFPIEAGAEKSPAFFIVKMLCGASSVWVQILGIQVIA